MCNHQSFAHIPKDERSKYDGKARSCIYLKNSQEKFGYRLWDLKDKKVFQSRDVIFLEDQTLEDIKKDKKEKSILMTVVLVTLLSPLW